MVVHGGSSAGSYLADPTSPIPSHCASIVVTSTLRVNWVVLFTFHDDISEWDIAPVHVILLQHRAHLEGRRVIRRHRGTATTRTRWWIHAWNITSSCSFGVQQSIILRRYLFIHSMTTWNLEFIHRYKGTSTGTGWWLCAQNVISSCSFEVQQNTFLGVTYSFMSRSNEILSI